MRLTEFFQTIPSFLFAIVLIAVLSPSAANVVIAIATVINYIDRQTLSVLSPVLTRELNLSPIEYSNILTAFLAAYTVMYVGSGFLVDRFGTRLSLSVFIVWWSLANMTHAFSRGPWSLGVLRFLLGMGESGNFMAAFKVVSEWYPAKERDFDQKARWASSRGTWAWSRRTVIASPMAPAASSFAGVIFPSFATWARP
jgi:MFS family permease